MKLQLIFLIFTLALTFSKTITLPPGYEFHPVKNVLVPRKLLPPKSKIPLPTFTERTKKTLNKLVNKFVKKSKHLINTRLHGVYINRDLKIDIKIKHQKVVNAYKKFVEPQIEALTDDFSNRYGDLTLKQFVNKVKNMADKQLIKAENDASDTVKRFIDIGRNLLNVSEGYAEYVLFETEIENLNIDQLLIRGKNIIHSNNAEFIGNIMAGLKKLFPSLVPYHERKGLIPESKDIHIDIYIWSYTEKFISLAGQIKQHLDQQYSMICHKKLSDVGSQLLNTLVDTAERASGDATSMTVEQTLTAVKNTVEEYVNGEEFYKYLKAGMRKLSMRKRRLNIRKLP